MGTTALRQLLKNLCNNSVWNYAVLWKLRHGSPAILTWEDGYFNYPKTRELDGTVSDDACCKGACDMLSPEFSSSSEDHSVGLEVAAMSGLQYALGEGFVGKVASERDHCWVSIDIFTGEVKCPQEWLPQFVSGVKTILLVSVLPHGVLQLGSLEEVPEDINIIAYIKSRFDCLQSVHGNITPVSLKEEQQPSLKSCSIEYLSSLSCNAFTSLRTEDLAAVDNAVLDNNNLSTASQNVPPLTVEDAFMPAGKILPNTFGYEGKNAIDVSCTSLAPSESIDASELEMVESKLYELSCLMEELQGYSVCNDYSMGLCGESFNEIMNSYPVGDVAAETSSGKADTDRDNNILSSFLGFPEDSELHKALEPASRKQPNEMLWDVSLLVGDTCNISSLSRNKDRSERTEMSWVAGGADAGYLLEAVVANTSSTEDTSNLSHNLKLCNSLSEHYTVSPNPQKQYKSTTFARDDSLPLNHLTSLSVTGVRTADDSSCTFKTTTRTIFGKGQQERGYDDVQLRKGNKASNISKRWAKPGDNQKPRPRDRQLIQERVRELRELVPNGAKCSIDSLLDRTVKHMLYLRSVTNQAEKLKQCVHQETDGRNNWRSSDTVDICENGKSWALEFSNEFRACPIIVEDLAHTGCLLIEILCNEHGLFLEIAEVIRGLDLTILKGVQESRSNNTWARFIVERSQASKGFHRLDIFWPLMQLLQRKRNPISSKI